MNLSIPQFGGNQPVTEFDYYPLNFHPEKERVLERLRVRAEKAIGYQELSYCEYNGVALAVQGCEVQRHNVSFIQIPEIVQIVNENRYLVVS